MLLSGNQSEDKVVLRNLCDLNYICAHWTHISLFQLLRWFFHFSLFPWNLLIYQDDHNWVYFQASPKDLGNMEQSGWDRSNAHLATDSSAGMLSGSKTTKIQPLSTLGISSRDIIGGQGYQGDVPAEIHELFWGSTTGDSAACLYYTPTMWNSYGYKSNKIRIVNSSILN